MNLVLGRDTLFTWLQSGRAKISEEEGGRILRIGGGPWESLPFALREFLWHCTAREYREKKSHREGGKVVVEVEVLLPEEVPL